MALEQPREALGKVSIVFATKLKSFTFLPVLKKLPTENKVKSVREKGSSKLSETLRHHAEDKIRDEGSYKAEIVYVCDLEPQEITEHSETQQKSTTKSAIAPLPTPAVTHDEVGRTSPKHSPGTLDTSDNKHPRTPQLGSHNNEAEVSPVLFSNSESQREEEVLSPVSSVDIFTSPFSSKESILSEGWEQETGWSVLQMLSPSGSVSSCSSVRSGAFTPSVMRIKSHTLSPGSSLMQMPLTSCQTLGCNKHITSPCPLSTYARHRPPPTQLSLLTAILRKGRLPVLSSALQRPYSPCWPISSVNMSSCKACSAASTVAPMVGLQANCCVSKGTTCTEPSCKEMDIRKIQGNGHTSNDTTPIVRNKKTCQTSSSDLKRMQMAQERFPNLDHKPIQQSQEILASAVPKYTDVKPDSLLQNDRKIVHELEKINSVSPVFQHSPPPTVAGLTHLSNRSISPVVPSPKPSSCTSTSDRYTLSSSPVSPYHHLSPSPAFSLCSSPTPLLRDGTPDCIDSGNKKPNKIKSGYKALAAIPTNTLLLEQQAIDDEVNKNNAPLDPSDSFAWEDPHSQMCSPAQLRQQSSELYQVIDDVLKDTNQTRPLSPANKLTVKSVTSVTTRKLTPSPSPSPRPLGRETKYANFQPPAPAEKTLTKPGVIRPAMVMLRLDDDKKKSCFLNTIQKQQESLSSDHQSRLASSMLSTKDEHHGGEDLERERDSSEVPEKCMSSSAPVMNQARQHSTLEPRGASL